MNFKTFLESSNIIVSQMNSDGSAFTIVYPSGVYKYTTDHYGPYIIRLNRKYDRAPGRFANAVKELVDKGFVNSKKIK